MKIPTKKSLRLWPLPVLLIGLAVFALPFPSKATSPPSGSLSPTTTTPLTFVGTAPGTGADSEPDGIEGVNKDTYVLTVLPGIYTGKLISVTLSWTNPANDRDLYVFKRNADGSNGQQVGASAGGAPQTGKRPRLIPTFTARAITTSKSSISRVPRPPTSRQGPSLSSTGRARVQRPTLLAASHFQPTQLARRPRLFLTVNRAAVSICSATHT